MMSRKLIVSIHLYLAAFFAPMVIIMAISGGLYLFGIKGNMNYQPLQTLEAPTWSDVRAERQQQLKQLLQDAQLNAEFEYVKEKGDTWYTRPTSRQHYKIELQGSRVSIAEANPDLQAMIMELHKGHGPGWFKWLEKLFAIALVVVMLSGMALGLLSPMFKKQTVILSCSGILAFAVLALM